MSDVNKVLIVGASAAGSTTAVQLRAKGFGGEIQLVGDEPYAPYDRPPLSKQFLNGSWSQERLLLESSDTYRDLRIQLCLGVSAVGLDPLPQLVQLSDDRWLSYDALVIATGVAPRRLPQAEGLSRVHYLRNIDDALALRARLLPGARLVIVGAGFVGLEVAATARELGCEVDVIEALDVPLARALGHQIGSRIQALHERHGVRFHTGCTVERFADGDGDARELRLSDGTTLVAHDVVIGVGTVPSTGWLAGSGLIPDSELLCDELCRVQSGVYAAGDIAAVVDRQTGQRLHTEHRANATRHARIVAAEISGQPSAVADLPFFWTDQYGIKIQMYGTPTVSSHVDVVEEASDPLRLVATYREGGDLAAVVGWNATKSLLPYTAELRARARLSTSGVP